MKTCSKCKIERGLDRFPASSRNKNRLDSWCKNCRAAASKLRAAKNPDAVREAARKWREANAKEYREVNREKIRLYQKAYVAKHPDRVRESRRSYVLRNPDAVAASAQKSRADDARKNYMNAYVRGRQARQKKATPIWVNMQKVRAVYAEARKIRKSGVNVHVDHIVPIKSDVVCGLHWEGNLQILPAVENIRKGNRLISLTQK